MAGGFGDAVLEVLGCAGRYGLRPARWATAERSRTAPELRPRYEASCDAAFVADPGGRKLKAVCQ